MLKAKGKVVSLLTACLTMLIALVLGFAALFTPTPITTANAEETTETLTITGTTGKLASDNSSISWTSGNITFVNEKASSSTNIRNSDSDHYRAYVGSKITVSVNGEVIITEIVFTTTSSSYNGGASSTSDVTYSPSGTTVKVTPKNESNSITFQVATQQLRIKTAKVTYEKAETGGDSECAHATTSEEETKAPTCTEAGEKTITCSDCGNVTTEAIEATGHSFTDGVCTVCGEKQPTSATLTFDDTTKRTSFSTAQQVWEENGITLTNSKHESTNNVADYANPARFYKNSTVTIACVGMTKIVFTCNTAAYATSLGKSIGATAEVSGKEVTVTFDSAADSFEVTLSDGQVRMDFLTVYVSKVSAERAHIDGASLSLGESLAMNYYVSSEEDLSSARMYFNFNDTTYDVEGEKQSDGRYMFTLENIAPQYMTENIKAELKLNDTLLASMEEYSVQTYAQNMLNDNPSNELKQLLTAMLYYGDAAQVHEGKEATTTAGVIGKAEVSDFKIAQEGNEIRLVDNPDVDTYPAWFVSANIWFSSVNKIRVTLSTAENVTLKINGVEVPVNGTTVYTDGIKATELGNEVKFELYHNGTLMQTLYYSVYSYAYSMQDSAKMGELVKALYRYGEAAVAYASANA